MSKITDSIRISSEFFFIYEKFPIGPWFSKNFVYQVCRSNRIHNRFRAK
ncbi:hypothetical protein LEP1GSC060_1206 [Leptospira weilii serovar Ranarum str. ICFT]|uniref:Uncharacterized protein n=1 Tax=Leptospira weilii serovar Ranarum str. ICFT TaxID=1218598 RepID=N1WPA0_9LEPT|nr:hypothetical protein LEP1GSC060_1206 [Leptospira weilii serovar Ranarum str. ICFT]